MIPAFDIRSPTEADDAALFEMVAEFATSFSPDQPSFTRSLSSLIGDDDVTLLCAYSESRMCGYVLAFTHNTFFANGPVTWVEEMYEALGYEESAVYYRHIL